MRTSLFQRFTTISVALGAIVLISASVCAGDNVVFVDADATNGANDGTSWADAFTDLQDGLAEATTNPGIDTIWVADGMYIPTGQPATNSFADRSMTFEMISGVEVYGGFLGNEAGGNEQDLADRDVINNPAAILSGEISDDTYILFPDGNYDCADGDGDCFVANGTPGCDDAACCEYICGNFNSCCEDGWDQVYADIATGKTGAEGCCKTTPDLMDNAHHVVTADGVNDSARLDGFVIRDGGAYDLDASETVGAGLYIIGGSDLAVINCTIIENCAFYLGGDAQVIGLGMNSAEPVFYDCAFLDNEAHCGSGGAISYNTGGSDIVNTLFAGNAAGTNFFIDDSQGGAIYAPAPISVILEIVNSTFSLNSADDGAAIHNGNCEFTVTNSIFWNNENDPDNPDPMNQITGDVTSELFVITYSDIEGGGFGGASNNNLDVDPEFVNPAAGNFRLQSGSEVIDMGDPQTIMAFDDIFDVDDDTDDDEPTPDLDLQERIVSRLPDMGSYEFPNDSGECLGDLNDDGEVDGADLGILLGAWGECVDPLPVPAELSEYAISQGCLDLFESTMRYGTQAEKDNALCWMEHYLSCHCDQGICHCPPNSCSGADPCNGH